MIKINLATRKQAVGVSGGGDGGTATSLKRMTVDLNSLKDLPIRRAVLPIVVGLMASFALDSYKEDELKKVDDQIAKLSAEKQKLQVEANKMRGYEEVKKNLEADERALRVKVETIRKLIADRQTPPKLLISIAESIPKDVWLTEFKVIKKEVGFKGSALGFNQISDFMKSLNENLYFADVSMKSTQQVKDKQSGSDLAEFELSAKRRID